MAGAEAQGVDYQGIALVIAALGVAIPSIIGAIVSVIALDRGRQRDTKLDNIQRHVNGMNEAIKAGARAEGVLEGGNAERANPTGPKNP